MRKTYIIDTSVLIYDPNSFKTFFGNDIVIPINVLDELDKIKSSPNEAGKNARLCIRMLDALCKKGDIHKGIKIENNILLKIDTSELPDKFGPASYVDNKIISCAYNVKEKNNKKKTPIVTILVSKDINLRVRARAFGIQAQDYEKDKTSAVELYQGFKVLKNVEIGQALLKNNFLDICMYDELQELRPNECIHVESESGNGISIGRRSGNKLISIKNKKPWGLDLRNKEQAFAADLLCDPKVPLVSLVGQAGTGKSIIALASALEMVVEKKIYNKLIIYRPIQPVGNDIGWLPGTLQEKLSPWMQPIYDNLEVLFTSKNGQNWKKSLDYAFDRGMIEMEAITYIRGRSIPKVFILVDEVQNLNKEEVKTILTRVGTDTKIVLTGDIEQIDKSCLDAGNNGLSYVVEKFKDIDLAGHVTLTKGERSALASKAAEIL